MKQVQLTWEQVYERVKHIPQLPCYGIPRGGAIVAGLTGMATSLEKAEIIVDDIIDSGRTMTEWKRNCTKPFYSLYTKEEFPGRPWVVFPWEIRDTEYDIKNTVIRQLEYIGENPSREGLKDTPLRVHNSWQQLYSGYHSNPSLVLKTEFNAEKYNQMVVLKDIEFYSMCEHHMLPFFGTAKIAYLPDKKVVGISKLARLLECFSRRLQIQERLTAEIAHTLNDTLKPLGVGVVLEAKHLCMISRGIQKQNSIMTTSCLLGQFLDNQQTREEFLRL